jgi:hypothetical protein
MKRIPRRTFATEFKAEAIKLVTEKKLTHAEVIPEADFAWIYLLVALDDFTKEAALAPSRLSP